MAVTKIVSPGVFIRGVVLGEFGVNNLIDGGVFNSVLQKSFWDTKGWSDVKLQVGFAPMQVKIPEHLQVWHDILKDHETNLSVGGTISDAIRDLAYVNAYPILTSTEAQTYLDAIRIINVFLQHLVFFERALPLPLNWQRLQ